METNRVLSRVGARIVNEEELQQIAGGFIARGFGSFNTGACNYDPVTCRVISDNRRLASASSPAPKID